MNKRVLNLDDRSPPESASGKETDYKRAQRRKSLYRVLASNIVRELRDAGYHGDELLGFASEIMQAINDNGWGRHVGRDKAACRPGVSEASSSSKPQRNPVDAESSVTTDAQGRPILIGKRVRLRPPTEADGPALKQWSEDPEIRTSLIPVVLQHVIEHLNGDKPPDDRVDRIDLIVCDRATEASIGLVSLHDMDWEVGQAALGKMIGEPAYRGKGIAREATHLIVNYGFEALGLNRIYLCTLGGNMKNIRLNEHMGFRFEGVLQEAAVSQDRRADVVLMAMLRSEFRNGAGR